MSSKNAETASETLSSLSAIQTLLKNYPILNTSNEFLQNSGDSFSFMCNILSFFPTKDGKSVQTRVIEWISKTLCGNGSDDGFLNVVETLAKAALLANLKKIFTCSINPFIPDEYMLPGTVTKTLSNGTVLSRYINGKGIALELSEIDFFNLFSKCPTSDEGKMFYFDAGEAGRKKKKAKKDNTYAGSKFVGGYKPGELWKSADLNAFLWYVINKGTLNKNSSETYKLYWDNRVQVYKKFYLNGEFVNEDLYNNFFGGNITTANTGAEKTKDNIIFKDKSLGSPINFEDYYKYPVTYVKGGGNAEKYDKKDKNVCKKIGIVRIQYEEGSGTGTDGDKIRIYINPYRYATRMFQIPYYYPVKVSTAGLSKKTITYNDRGTVNITGDDVADQLKVQYKDSAKKYDYVTNSADGRKWYYTGRKWKETDEIYNRIIDNLKITIPDFKSNYQTLIKDLKPYDVVQLPDQYVYQIRYSRKDAETKAKEADARDAFDDLVENKNLKLDDEDYNTNNTSESGRFYYSLNKLDSEVKNALGLSNYYSLLGNWVRKTPTYLYTVDGEWKKISADEASEGSADTDTKTTFSTGWKLVKQKKVVGINHTLTEFNYDFLRNVKIFDAKTLVTNIINEILGLASTFNIGLTLEQQIIAGQVAKVVENVINEEDSEVTDCYYSFSNDDYETLLEKAQLQHYAKSTLGGDSNNLVSINTEEIAEALNAIDEAATLEEQKDAIANAFTVAAKTLEPTEGSYDYNFSFVWGSGVLQKLLKQTVLQIVLSILSPKIMLLYLLNVKMMGDIDPESDWDINIKYDWKSMFSKWLNTITDMASQIANAFLKEMLAWVIGEIKSVIQAYSIALVKESVEEYRKMIETLIDNCIPDWGSRKATSEDMIDNVQEADIVPTQTLPNKDNC